MGSRRTPLIREDELSRWKAAFLKLPDSAFFELLRNYLGELKTPYNKHTLLESLEGYLRNPDTRARILALIDPADALLLTAIFYLPHPSREALSRLVAGEFGYLELHNKLLNLQDRLLIYAIRDEAEEEFSLTPLLQDDLLERVIDPEILIPSRPAYAFQPLPLLLNDTLLSSLLSFFLDQEIVLKADGSLRKQIETRLFEAFPLFQNEPSLFSRIFRAFQVLGLIRIKNNRAVPDLPVWKEFCTFTPAERILLLLRAMHGNELIVSCREGQWLNGFLRHIPPGKGFSRTGFLRYALLCMFHGGEDLPIDTDWIDDLCQFHILIPAEPENGSAQSKDAAFFTLNPALYPNPLPKGQPRLILQPNFEATIVPGTVLSDSFFLAVCCRIRRYDLYPAFELTKHSFYRALAEGLTATSTCLTFKNLTTAEVPQNISMQLTSWENEYHRIRSSDLVIVQVDETQRTVLEQHGKLQKLIQLNPAPGIYLVRKENIEAFVSILKDMGMEIPPPPSELGVFQSDEEKAEQRLFFYFFPWNSSSPRIDFPDLFPLPKNGSNALPGKEKEVSASRMMKELIQQAESLDMPEDHRTEILYKIQRKLILHPDQIKPETKKLERTEAKGLDYAGKAVLIEQVISSPSDYVEVQVRNARGSPERFFLRPRELRKTGPDLVLIGSTLPKGEEVEIPVRKISLVRRIRGFLVGGKQ